MAAILSGVGGEQMCITQGKERSRDRYIVQGHNHRDQKSMMTYRLILARIITLI